MTQNDETAPQPVLDAQTQAFLNFLKASGRPELHTLPVPEARAVFAKGQALVPVTKMPVDVEERTLPVGPNGKIKVYIVRPQASKEILPAFIYFHGGGWVVGSFETHDRAVRYIAATTRVAVVFVEYSLSPEAQYPVANEEAYAATKWISEHGAEVGIDASRIVVGGDSAGGTMATAVCMMSKQHGGPRIAAQILIYPTTGGSPDLPSRQQFASGYFFSQETANWFWSHYSGGRPIHTETGACPLRASVEDLKALPPALIITAECDVLRDEGELYARKLMQAGVPVICTRYLGAIHGFVSINALAESAATKAAIEQVCGMLRDTFAARTSGQTA
ncbi:MAG: lipase [Candidatus Angelobacter sp. Gp1-AA117]|nr:MAG: lipase [Candidatus Angelobacter sp. Gp1-AA117]